MPLIQIPGHSRELHARVVDGNGKILMEFDYAIGIDERVPRVIFLEGHAFLRIGAGSTFSHVPSLRIERGGPSLAH